MQNELEASFIYEDTDDQLKVTKDIKNDMESEQPMDRLICGDVGFGKTELAIRAAFKAVDNNKQVAVLVPTTILAFQHYKTFSSRLNQFPVTVDYLNRFKTNKEKSSIIEKLHNGKIDIKKEINNSIILSSGIIKNLIKRTRVRQAILKNVRFERDLHLHYNENDHLENNCSPSHITNCFV